MAITMGTAVFHRIIKEAKEEVKQAAIRALADTMRLETTRFCHASPDYATGCAKDRLAYYLTDKEAICTNNQVIPKGE